MGAEHSALIDDMCALPDDLVKHLTESPKQRVPVKLNPRKIAELRVDDRHETLMRSANNTTLLARLLDDIAHHGFNVNFQDPATGDSALHLAAGHGNILSCKQLLDHGASMMSNHDGLTPSDVAAACGHRDVQFFLEARAQTPEATASGCSPTRNKGGLLLGTAEVWGDVESGSGVSTWTTAFLVLTPTCLESYESVEAFLLNGRRVRLAAFDVRGARAMARSSHGAQGGEKRFEMQVVDTSGGLLRCRCASAAARAEWLAALRSAARLSLRSQTETDLSLAPTASGSGNSSRSDSKEGARDARLQRASFPWTPRVLFAGRAFSRAHSSEGRLGPAGAKTGAGVTVRRTQSAPEEASLEIQSGCDSGDQVRALYNYTAEAGCPYIGDKRGELSLSRGERLKLLTVKDDGFCLCTRLTRAGHTSGVQGYVSGNFLTVDGRHPLVPDARPARDVSSWHALRKHGLGPRPRRAGGPQNGTVSRSDQVALQHMN
jgi:hypothetical protein